MRRVHASYEYLLKSGRFIRLPRFIWKHLDNDRRRVTFS